MKLSTSVRLCLANALKTLVHKVSTALLDTNPSRKQDTIIPSLKRGYLSLLFLDCPLIPITRAKDVTTFLAWTAEPQMEARKKMGMQVFVFLIILTLLLYFTKKKVWADAH